MTPAISVLADRYRPRKSTAARGRAFGRAAEVGTGFLLIIVILSAVYFVGAILR